MQPKRLFLTFAKGEAITWTLLISALVIRAMGDPIPAIVTIAGSIHGAVFVGYAVSALLVGINQRWGFGKVSLAVALAIVPELLTEAASALVCALPTPALDARPMAIVIGGNWAAG